MSRKDAVIRLLRVRAQKPGQPTREEVRDLKRLGKLEFIRHPVNTYGPNDANFLGIARDRNYHAYSTCMYLLGYPSHGVTAEEDRSRVLRWQGFLDPFAFPSYPVRTLSWTTQTTIGDPLDPRVVTDEIRDYYGAHGEISPELSNILAESRRRNSTAVMQDTSITYTMKAKPMARRIRRAGGAPNLMQELTAEMYRRTLGRGAGQGPLGLVHLAPMSYNYMLMRNLMALDPVSAQPLLRDWVRLKEGLVVESADGWPEGSDMSPWEYCRFGKTYHIGYYISGFPSTGFFNDDFWDLVDTPIPKSVTVVVKMVSHKKASKQQVLRTTGTTSRVKDMSKKRRITGFDEEEVEQDLEAERQMARREMQVGELRVYIAINGTSVEEVTENAANFRELAMGQLFSLKALDGRHHYAVIPAMPFGRGLGNFLPD